MERKEIDFEKSIILFMFKVNISVSIFILLGIVHAFNLARHSQQWTMSPTTTVFVFNQTEFNTNFIDEWKFAIMFECKLELENSEFDTNAFLRVTLFYLFMNLLVGSREWLMVSSVELPFQIRIIQTESSLWLSFNYSVIFNDLHIF